MFIISSVTIVCVWRMDYDSNIMIIFILEKDYDSSIMILIHVYSINKFDIFILRSNFSNKKSFFKLFCIFNFSCT